MRLGDWADWGGKEVDLSPGKVHLFATPVAKPHHLPQLLNLLAPEEQARATRFRRQADTLRWATSRAAVRDLLATLTGLPPHRLTFALHPLGKPFLPHPPRAPLFSISHSGDWALCGITSWGAQTMLGADVEAIRPLNSMAQLARFAFSPGEFASWQTHAPDSQASIDAFFGTWTLKEAYIKALGLGLHLDLSSFEVDPDSATLRRADHPGAGDSGDWQLWHGWVDPHHRAALALRGPLETVCCWRHRLPLTTA